MTPGWIFDVLAAVMLAVAAVSAADDLTPDTYLRAIGALGKFRPLAGGPRPRVPGRDGA